MRKGAVGLLKILPRKKGTLPCSNPDRINMRLTGKVFWEENGKGTIGGFGLPIISQTEEEEREILGKGST